MIAPLVRAGMVVTFLASASSHALGAQSGAPGGVVPPDLLTARRAAVLRAMPKGMLVVTSAKLRSVEGDYPQDADYRENNDFFYLTGLEAPNGVLVFVQPDSGGSAGHVRLYLPAPPAVRDAWSAARTYAEPATARLTGLESVLTRPAGNRGGPDPMPALLDSLATASGALPRLNPRQVLGPIRQVKDADELRRLRQASVISANAHIEAMRAVQPGMWEYELEATVEYHFRRQGAERLGYPSIVASGPNATILHYDLSRRRIGDGELVLIDAAAEFGLYTSDVTRTFPASGKFTERQRTLYDLVLGAHEAALAAIKPGVTIAELNTTARAYLRDHSQGLCGATTCDKFMNHGLSHWVGMDVHDVGPYFVKLEPGMTFSVEPGIYLPDEGIGIRIEDVVVVTPTGHDNLTASVPRKAAEIEALMAPTHHGKKR